MPLALDVFNSPDAYWSLLTSSSDADFEDQHFDRKEAGRPEGAGTLSSSALHKLIGHATETISAFANENRAGGLLVLGISKIGEVKGLAHLSDEQRNSLCRPNDWLVNHNSRVKLFDCTDQEGQPAKICLIYVPYTDGGICQAVGNPPKTWRRQGAQNILLTPEQVEQMRRDKGIVAFEQQICCEFDERDLDMGVVEEFRKVYLSDARFQYSVEELLHNAGALRREGNKYWFNNAGFLFFAANPQREMSWAEVRLLRFEAMLSQANELGLNSLDKSFTGSLPQQIRNLRVYFQESGFFKKYQRRKPDGGFADEPEFPLVAVDEAVVNAVVHRDYAVRLPIECRKYTDAILTTNPGRVVQQELEVPLDFSLNEVRLNHLPRNPKLLAWFKLLKDERGAEFVRALSEGTLKMKEEMEQLALPAPRYHVNPYSTSLTLFNNAAEREALFRSATADAAGSEFTNLYPLRISGATALNTSNLREFRREVTDAFKTKLSASGWFIDRSKIGRLYAHKRGADLPLPVNVSRAVRFFPAYSFQVREYWQQLFLTVDFTLEVKNILPVSELRRYFNVEELIRLRAVANWNGRWCDGKIVGINDEYAVIELFEYKTQEQISTLKVIPNLPIRKIETVVANQDKHFDLSRAIKQAALALEQNASRVRAAKTDAVVKDISNSIFPITVRGSIGVTLQSTPATLSRDPNQVSTFAATTLPEPVVEFHHRQETPDIRQGITDFGAYDKDRHDIELVPIVVNEHREAMGKLIERLKAGKYRYKGSERTFSARFSYSGIVTASHVADIENQCQRLLSEHPEWTQNSQLSRLFLVHAPEAGFSLDDEASPYYRTKRLLLEIGLPCQMVDTPTLLNPDWKDLNLALNIVAKCGVVPWVLPDAVPDADFFIGLSYTQTVRKEIIRTVGYANVFNSYGRWEFYSANTEAFPFEEKTKYFKLLIGQTLSRLNLSETPNIYFHYSAKFSTDDRAAILEAARAIRPKGTYSFVWINSDHNIRLYDRRLEGNGSLSRGSFVVTSPSQLLLSTSGFNPYRKTLGTPQPLELNIITEEKSGRTRKEYDLRALAVQMLSLTKLNWASTDSLCAEPITTKYAGDVAYLTAAFMRQPGKPFKLHPRLERTPWFI